MRSFCESGSPCLTRVTIEFLILENWGEIALLGFWIFDGILEELFIEANDWRLDPGIIWFGFGLNCCGWFWFWFNDWGICGFGNGLVGLDYCLTTDV
jgi:hypothetical protein